MLHAKKILYCPHCGHTNIQQKNKVRNIAALTGLTLGTAAALTSILIHAARKQPETSLSVILYEALISTDDCSLSEASYRVLLGALAIGTTLGITVVKLGQALDQLLNLHVCPNCGYTFGGSNRHASSNPPTLKK